MRYLVPALAILIACNQTRERTDTANYEVISEKCFVLRAHASNADSLVNLQRDSVTAFLETHGFKMKKVEKDSLMFRRQNGLEVDIVLPRPQDAWESNTVVVFDPQKNPLFVNLRKGTAQLKGYVGAQ